MSQAQISRIASSSQTNLREEPSRQNSGRSHLKQIQTRRPDSVSSPGTWDTETVLDTTYNRLQELMQLLYLLSRDPAVPNDARYHVTVAQSEIALLSRVMQNSASTEKPACAFPCPPLARRTSNRL